MVERITYQPTNVDGVEVEVVDDGTDLENTYVPDEENRSPNMASVGPEAIDSETAQKQERTNTFVPRVVED